MHRGRGGRWRHPAPAAPRLGCWVAAWRRVRRSRGPAGQSVSPSVMGAGCPGRGRGASVGVEQRGTGFWGPRAAPLRLRSPPMDFRQRTMPPPGLPLTGPPRPSSALQAPPHRAAPRDGHEGHSLQSRLPALWLSCGVCTAPGRTLGASLVSAVRDDEAPRPVQGPPRRATRVPLAWRTRRDVSRTSRGPAPHDGAVCPVPLGSRLAAPPAAPARGPFAQSWGLRRGASCRNRLRPDGHLYRLASPFRVTFLGDGRWASAAPAQDARPSDLRSPAARSTPCSRPGQAVSPAVGRPGVA